MVHLLLIISIGGVGHSEEGQFHSEWVRVVTGSGIVY